jgi:hypothetical protein
MPHVTYEGDFKGLLRNKAVPEVLLFVKQVAKQL